jgi:hypothetical protein
LLEAWLALIVVVCACEVTSEEPVHAGVILVFSGMVSQYKFLTSAQTIIFVSYLFLYHLRLVVKNLTTHENLKTDKRKLLVESGSYLSNIYNRVFRRWGFPSIIGVLLSLERSGNKIEATGLSASPRRRFDGNTCGDWRRTLLDFLRPVPNR